MTKWRWLAGAALLGVALLVGVMPQRIGMGAQARHVAAHNSAPARYPAVYVAIGASDSYGVGADNPATQSWPADLARRLPHGTHFVNLGVPGILLHRAVQAELPVALDAHPSLVTVWLAVNDMAAGVPLSQYRHDLGVLLGALQQAHARVLIANVPDLSLIPAFAGRLGVSEMIAAWNAAIAAEAQAHGATLVDLYGHWRELAQHPDYVGPDGLHPTVAGYERLADLFFRTYTSTR